MIKFNCYKFTELTPEQLYAILALRAEVFVVGQGCVYQDPDGKDVAAIHLLGMENNELVAYARIFPPKTLHHENVIFGRVAVAKSARGKSYGKQLMQQLLDYCDNQFPSYPIKCSAQHYLLKFYKDFGFIARGDVYNEENIPHIEMTRVLA